jgi:RNA polymerase sigma-70 factor, ECF subfamily
MEGGRGARGGDGGRIGASGSSGAPNPATPSGVSEVMHVLAADAPNGFSSPIPARRTPPSAVGDVLAAREVDDFEALFTAHYDRLVRALSVIAGDAESAADAVQEAFVRAHLRWRRISGYDDPIGWIRRVAINQLRDGHRRQERKNRALLRLAGREQHVVAATEIDEFDRLLAELPKQQRAATALFYVDGLSVAEIATALSISEGSVKSHLHDARRRLRPVLEREQTWAAPPAPPTKTEPS